jgi:hypothetical protein
VATAAAAAAGAGKHLNRQKLTMRVQRIALRVASLRIGRSIFVS